MSWRDLFELAAGIASIFLAQTVIGFVWVIVFSSLSACTFKSAKNKLDYIAALTYAAVALAPIVWIICMVLS